MPKLKITGRKIDKKTKENLEEFLNYGYAEHEEFIESIVSAKILIRELYGISILDFIWERIEDAYLKKVIELEKKHG